jgi:hypothetical protein
MPSQAHALLVTLACRYEAGPACRSCPIFTVKRRVVIVVISLGSRSSQSWVIWAKKRRRKSHSQRKLSLIVRITSPTSFQHGQAIPPVHIYPRQSNVAMTALAALLHKDEQAATSGDNDGSSLGHTVATEDSVQRAKRSEKTTRRGGKKSGSKKDLGASLGDLSAVLEGLGESASSFGSEPDTMTTCTADSRDVAQKRISKKRGGRKKSKQSMALEEEEEEVVHRKRTISMDDE